MHSFLNSIRSDASRRTRQLLLSLLSASMLGACGGGSSGSSSTTPGATTPPAAAVPTLALLAGNSGGPGNADGTGQGAAFNLPFGVATDASGTVYIADTFNHTIRKTTAAGVTSTLAGSAGNAGSANGTGKAAQFSRPGAVTVDASGVVYVADTNNHTIRKITAAGVVTTLAGVAGTSGNADGPSTSATFSSPGGVTIDASGNVLVADSGNNAVRKITPAGVVSTLAGSTAGAPGNANAQGTNALFNGPSGIAMDGFGNVYVADSGNNTIRKISSAGDVTTIAGTGSAGFTDNTGTNAAFDLPFGLTIDSAGNIYVADYNNNAIRKISSGGVVTTWAGQAAYGSADGTGTAASFAAPQGVAVDASGTLYVADTSNSTLRKITNAQVVSTLAGTPLATTGSTDAVGAAATFDIAGGNVTVDANGNVYVNEKGNFKIRKITPNGTTTTFFDTSASLGGVDAFVSDAAGNLFFIDRFHAYIGKITPSGIKTVLAGGSSRGNTNGTGPGASFNLLGDITIDAAGNLYVVDFGNKNVRKITQAGVVTTVATSFVNPSAITVDSTGNLYVADRGSNSISKITPAGVVSALAGDPASGLGFADGTGTAAVFAGNFNGMATDASGNVYVADSDNNAIRKITPAGVVTTLAGGPDRIGFAPGKLPAAIRSPYGLAILGNTLYFSDGNTSVAKISNLP